MKKIVIGIFLLAGLSDINAQSNYILWSFETNDRILSLPVIDNDVVYFGSNDDYFYAVNATTGAELWSFETGFNVQSSVAVFIDILLIESGNNCYALDKNTGLEFWSYISGDPDGAEKLDPWDYHHAAPVIDDTMVYFACGNGRIYGFDLFDGEMKFQYEALDSAAIRATPVIDDEVMYFGDWDGRVYALDINSNDTIWTRKTYETQPYPTFGMVNTKMLIYDNLLIFGARNPKLQVLDKNTGNVVWDYTVPGGGWISGDPLVYNDTLFIGGSDCNKFFAFDVYTGELNWSYTFLFNNFSKPAICGDHIIFTTGDAYAYQGTNYGTGYLYSLNKADGSIYNFFQVGGNVFTTPVFNDGKIYVGSSDKHLYAIDSALFLSGTTDIKAIGYQLFDIRNLYPNPFDDSILIEYSIEYESEISVRVFNVSGTEVINLFSGKQKKGSYEILWDGRDAGNKSVSQGAYFIEVYSGSYKMSNIIVKN